MANKRKGKNKVKSSVKPPTVEVVSAPAKVKIAEVVRTVEDSVYEKVRPTHFSDMIGQARLKENFINLVAAAHKDKEVFGHTLLLGIKGTGKTTMGKIIARELGVHLEYASGTSFQQESDIVPLLKKLNRGDILFIDEIHKLRPRLRVFLYQVMDFFHYYYTKWEKGESIPEEGDVNHFCLMGATTESGVLEEPFLERFINKDSTELYSERQIVRVIKRSAGIWKVEVNDEAAMEIAKRSRFTPRIANNILNRVKKYATTQDSKTIDVKTTLEGCRLMGLDKIGLEARDLNYLKYLVKMKGGPAGVSNIGRAIGESKSSLEVHVEPYLIRIGFIIRTAKGRVLTEYAYKYLNINLDPMSKSKLATGTGNRYTEEPTKGVWDNFPG